LFGLFSQLLGLFSQLLEELSQLFSELSQLLGLSSQEVTPANAEEEIIPKANISFFIFEILIYIEI
jgi:hypothetical protein